MKTIWNATWIEVPESSATDYGVYLFRKTINLDKIPESLPVLVSADNRCKLYVNGELVLVGPPRGDAKNWNFVEVDLAPELRIGKNVIAAKVWNEGVLRAEANISIRTGFILQDASEDFPKLNTGGSWKCIEDQSSSPIPNKLETFIVVCPGEKIDMKKKIKKWKEIEFDDSNWSQASMISKGHPKYMVGPFAMPENWQLVRSDLPPMEMTAQRFAACRVATGIDVSSTFPTNVVPLVIPPNSEVSLLLDVTHNTVGYPTLLFSKGKHSEIKLTYAETLYHSFTNKGNRDEVNGKQIFGRYDLLLADGCDDQQFTSLYYRSFRYMQMDIKTSDEALVLNDVSFIYTGYPFELNAAIQTENKQIQKMFEVGWRSARLCAYDTYMDTPYYEQLQYVGDTRIQALVSLYNSGDDRLVKRALECYNQSIEADGRTITRYPTSNPQYITTFSLLYIGFLEDYMMYGSDLGFVQDKLPGVREILHFYSRFQNEDGTLKDLPGWRFTDWVEHENWNFGECKTGAEDNSSVLDLQLLMGLQAAAHLEEVLGSSDFADEYKKQAEALKTVIHSKYWDEGKGLFSDRMEKNAFSQHANILAILTETVTGKTAQDVAEKLLKDTSLAPASIYFKYYLHQALTKVGLGADYLCWLDKWRENLELGLTTWAETSELDSTRSDCHAWGSSPNIEFFRILLGIDSAAPAWSEVKIEPHLGDIEQIGGTIPHPMGEITVKYQFEGSKFHASVLLPDGLDGVFRWKGLKYALHSGENSLVLER